MAAWILLPMLHLPRGNILPALNPPLWESFFFEK
jgi:hypothetical protein